MTDSLKYKIGYVDENNHDINLFLQQFSDYFEIETLKPESTTTIEDVISWIMEFQLDLIVVDFDLKEGLVIDFCGNDILEKLDEHYLNFPMFMLTSHEERAIDESDASIDDVIYSKDNVSENTTIFVRRFENKISKYKSEISKAKTRHEELAQKSELTLEEEGEFLLLDDFIEQSYGKKGVLPKNLKSTESLEKLSELVDKADKILQNLERHE